MGDARFVVGIDLGTTNSVLAFSDTTAPGDEGEAPPIQVMAVPQLVKPARIPLRPARRIDQNDIAVHQRFADGAHLRR